METQDAIDLIREAIPKPGGTWADLGAGTGTFTRALASLIGADGEVIAIEPDDSARRELARLAQTRLAGSASIAVRPGDFTRPLELSSLSGIVMANALHFVPYAEQTRVLQRISTYLAPSGRIVLVEYNRDDGNQWVPYPVSIQKFVALCSAAGFTNPSVVGRMPSAFGGNLYAAWTSLA